MTDDLAPFRAWLLRRGRDPGTIEVYGRNVRLALAHADGIVGPLLDRKHAPKTRHLARAALRAWAKFTKDAALTAELDDIKLPDPKRKTPKLPLDKWTWTRLRNQIDTSESISNPMRAVLGLMAVRGFRVSDATRLRHEDVTRGLKTKVLAIEVKHHERAEIGIKLVRPYLELLAAEDDWDIVAELIAPASDEPLKRARINAWRALKVVGAEAELDVTHLHPHILRRTVAVNFVEKTGGDLNALQRYLWWRSPLTAQHYLDHDQRARFDKLEETLLD